MPGRNNKGIVTVRDVTRAAVAMQQLNMRTTTEEPCFLCGLRLLNNRKAVFSVQPVSRVIERAKKIVEGS
jgi:hypothetical protein